MKVILKSLNRKDGKISGKKMEILASVKELTFFSPLCQG